jgi:hypothetical protein
MFDGDAGMSRMGVLIDVDTLSEYDIVAVGNGRMAAFYHISQFEEAGHETRIYAH